MSAHSPLNAGVIALSPQDAVSMAEKSNSTEALIMLGLYQFALSTIEHLVENTAAEDLGEEIKEFLGALQDEQAKPTLN